MKQRIYVDHAATTPLDPQVFEAMRPYLTDHFGNPSTLYGSGREARRAVDEARDKVAQFIGAQSSSEIIFTSGGAEADNLAIKGVALAHRRGGNHIVVSAIEHQAVLHAAQSLEELGFDVTYVKPDRRGIVSAETVEEAITDDTILLSIMHANNETGTLQPIEKIATVAKRHDILFHCDAVQSAGHVRTKVRDLGCDFMSLSGHKIYGPKGVGVLYVRRNVPIEPLIHGGGQEQERRAGTENVAAIVGFARALELTVGRMEHEGPRLSALSQRLIDGLMEAVPDAILNGADADRLPSHVNMAFPGVEGESILLNLDMNRIEASSGSACTSGSIDASHVLLAMGLPRDVALSSIRLTLGRGNTDDDIDEIIRILPAIVRRLRNGS